MIGVDVAFPLLASGQHASENTIKLLDRKVFADVAVSASTERGVHLLLIVADTREDDDWQRRIHFAHERDQRDTVDFWHSEVNDGDFAIVLGQPGSGLKAIGQGVAGVASLAQVSDEEFRDAGVIIDD